ncbi:hypothetical protein K505DRAFT_42630 [Melanomma pulvis-pyrius CBS 109.77]|uniref:Uncharacterized protein n=1 Tax=Melanomma pulvis-pyrius CBS 109.77 TaxID=1314802 RepID=A0A6A6XBG2_9PLEO|nr:hypothetical protein K505DRAFT_42630 [Melanomma pulvis-pyrius CBS 109.77]
MRERRGNSRSRGRGCRLEETPLEALGAGWKWRLDRRADAERRRRGASNRSRRAVAQHDSTCHGLSVQAVTAGGEERASEQVAAVAQLHGSEGVGFCRRAACTREVHPSAKRVLYAGLARLGTTISFISFTPPQEQEDTRAWMRQRRCSRPTLAGRVFSLMGNTGRQASRQAGKQASTQHACTTLSRCAVARTALEGSPR